MFKKKKDSEKQKRYRVSRKVYIMFYLMGFILLMVLLVFKIKDYKLNLLGLILLIFFLLLVFKFTEVHRIRDYYELGENSILCSFGIITKNIKRIDYFAISDVDVRQSIIPRIFNYGDVIVRLFSTETSTVIKNIPNPNKFAIELEEKIMQKRKKSGN